ncbi:TetR/AcrR family transcriptional regulator [Dactylosporangium sp. CA-092794]|uniref:TetR/AcrR family transcriptional regulator n=1 Tax=Dactylosporangium sp. CA-092794 TaxID=3239929 RepID=UPI003D8BDA35
MKNRQRETNARGQGGRLREEILQAAAGLLERSSRDAVTLRAIARAAGIAAPSIYPHFADRDAILDAVVSRAFETLGEHCAVAAAGAENGAARVRAVAHAYAAFARERPGEYRLLFDRYPGNINPATPEYGSGRRAFQFLVDAIAEAAADGTGASADPMLDAQALWAALHGIHLLVPAMPGFPWRPIDEVVDHTITALAALR